MKSPVAPLVKPPTSGYTAQLDAVDYSDMSGVLAQTNANGDAVMGFFDPNDFVAYVISLQASGMYCIDLHLTSPTGKGVFEPVNANTDEELEFFDNMPITGSFDKFQTFTNLGKTPVAPPARSPVDMTPSMLFSKMLLASEYADMSGVQVQETLTLPAVALLDPGDFLTYEVDLPYTGHYEMEFEVASPTGRLLLHYLRASGR